MSVEESEVRRERDISSIMRRVRSRDTEAELAFRKALWREGVRYRLAVQGLPGSPDIVLPSKRTVIFVDGDYWHGNQWRNRGLLALDEQFRGSANKDYWLKKIRSNMDRDSRTTSALLSDGWRVFRVWESSIRSDLGGSVRMVLDAIRGAYQPSSYSVVPRKTFAEFFAGIGLVHMALERQGWHIAYANDIDEQKLEMYRGHFPDADEYFDSDDVHDVQPDRIPRVTLATASFPCNDLSLAGARKGLAGKQSSAFWGFVRVLDRMYLRRPPIVLLENVVGFLTSHGGSDFRAALLALNSLGYAVDAFILDAARFVPQSRQRMFVVGLLDQERRTWGIDDPAEVRESSTRPKCLTEFIAAHTEVRWHIRPLPEPPVHSLTLHNIIEPLDESATEWWSPDRAEYLLNQMSDRHRAVAEQMMAGSDWSYGTVFRRVRKSGSMAELRTDGVAGCLRTPRGGSGRQILFKAGMGRYFVRLLTPRECARLMGTDNYHITVGDNQALFGFGDAVCVPAVEWIATHYLNPVVNEIIHGNEIVPLREVAL